MSFPFLVQKRRLRPSKSVGGSGSSVVTGYLMRDTFPTDTASAAMLNSVNEPGPGTIIAFTDTLAAINKSGGNLNFSGAGSADYALSRLQTTGLTRVAGRTLIIRVTPAGTAGSLSLGWNSANPAGSNLGPMALFGSSSAFRDWTLSTSSLASYTAAEQMIAIALRATGHVTLMKIAGRWKVLYVHNAGTDATLYPAMLRSSNVYAAHEWWVPDAIWQQRVLASDSFDRANGALGTSDGLGCEEPCTVLPAWVVAQGTAAIATNKATFTALDGTSGYGIAVVETGEADVVIDCTVTTALAAGARAGATFRYVSPTDFSCAYYDNNANTIRVDQIVAGVRSNLVATAATIADSTAYRTFITVDGTTILVRQANSVQAAAVASANLTATKHGLFTDTGFAGTFDNFSVKPRYNDDFAPFALVA